MITDKDREQLLLMAGNIAHGLAQAELQKPGGYVGGNNMDYIARLSAKLSLATLRQVDQLIAEEKTADSQNTV